MQRDIGLVMRLVKTVDAAKYLQVDESFLRKKREVLFFIGIHYFRPLDTKLVRWDLDALDDWIRGEISEEAQVVLSNLMA